MAKNSEAKLQGARLCPETSKRVYVAPVLTDLGAVSTLTLGGSGTSIDGANHTKKN